MNGRRLVACACGLAVLSALAMAWGDVAVARYSQAHPVAGDLRRLLIWSEVYAHGLGVLVISAVVAVLDRRRRVAVRVAAIALLSGLTADLLKLTVRRQRPRVVDWAQVDGFLVGWQGLPGSLGSHDEQSFPSAHAAVAVALALGLTRLYPRGWWLFGLFALLAMGQRIEAQAHFLSDTLAGAAVGCLVAAALVDRWLWDVCAGSGDQ